MLEAAARMMLRPVSVPPVKAILSTNTRSDVSPEQLVFRDEITYDANEGNPIINHFLLFLLTVSLFG